MLLYFEYRDTRNSVSLEFPESTWTTTGDNGGDFPGYLCFLFLIPQIFFSISKHRKIHILQGKSLMYSKKKLQFQK